MKPRLVRDDELEILPAKVAKKLTETQVRRIEEMLSQPRYWAGAIIARQEMRETGRGLLLCGQIERDLTAGKSLSESDAFREWRQGAR